MPSPDYVHTKISDLLLEMVPMEPSREKALIITKLEEARHWVRDLKEKTDA